MAHLNGEGGVSVWPLGPRPLQERGVGVGVGVAVGVTERVVFQRAEQIAEVCCGAFQQWLCGSDVGDAVADGESRNGVAGPRLGSESVEAFFAPLSSSTAATGSLHADRSGSATSASEDEWLQHRTSMAQRDDLPGHGPTICRALAT